ncbi:MAG: protein-L-isoaspartate(D-aspartate) O-methyltransferase [Pirellulaceae bacterium]|nr:protein-L-isoaspartate(D-aspartate) O-methyltransferase [Thermoguttaceae bacterium]MDI9444927.1 protein-L-isoaspartate(D-aspartate) O-methyltransferase [Planctomycetota bacterium]NLZ02994.1 protein-L-isoaspartate(D-aspartate) O-methyltransferase [Pirellulaceae bacterium]
MPRPAAFFAFTICLALHAAAPALQAQTSQFWERLRNRMVDEEIVAAGVTNPRVIRALRMVPRHEHVPTSQRRYSYLDMALPIGNAQTISPPFVVAFMTEAIDPQPEDKVLEIGTGSGYQAAILSHLVKEVYTIEIVEPLGKQAAKVLEKYPNVHAKIGDGYQGWPEHAPFDKIIVTCSPEDVPPKLIEQLKEGGRMIVPVGQRYQQNLYLFRKQGGKLTREALRPTLFVPMTGEAESKRDVQPDPANPAIYNGGFEEFVEGTTLPNGWHYLRQGEVVSEGAPAGKRFLRFRNEQPGRGCGALQGLGIDGRKVKRIRMSLRLYAKGVRPGQNQQQLPGFLITFYNSERDMIPPHKSLGPWRGTFPWQTQSKVIDVPPQAREAIVRIGLFGAVGETGFDEVMLQRVDERTP